MARKKGSSKGPRLLRGKLGDKRAKAYLTRGLTRALQKQGKLKKRTRRTKAQMGMKKGRRGAPGKPKSAAHRKKIAAGVRAAHKRGAYKNVKRRKSSRRRKAA